MLFDPPPASPAFLSGVAEVIPDPAEALRVFYQLRKMETLEVVSQGESSLYFTPNVRTNPTDRMCGGLFVPPHFSSFFRSLGFLTPPVPHFPTCRT